MSEHSAENDARENLIATYAEAYGISQPEAEQLADKQIEMVKALGLHVPPVQYVQTWAAGDHCNECGGIGYHEDDCPIPPAMTEEE